MDLVFDIETDDLKATKIHCMCAQDRNSGETSSFLLRIDKGVELLQNAKDLIGHNIIGFDIPMLEKLT